MNYHSYTLIEKFCDINYSEKKVAHVISHQKQVELDLVGSWTVDVGDLDQALHLWRFKGGYAGVDKALKFLDENEVSLS